MGNPAANSLPRCQLSRLQQMVDQLCSRSWAEQKRYLSMFGPKKLSAEGASSSKARGFWMDSLCVPVRDENARKKAIRNMRNVYENADAVLVLDSWVQKLDSRSESVIEIAARLYLCSWNRRLWTLQEAVMAQNLFFELKNGPESFLDVWQRMVRVQKIKPYDPFVIDILRYSIQTIHYYPGPYGRTTHSPSHNIGVF